MQKATMRPLTFENQHVSAAANTNDGDLVVVETDKEHPRPCVYLCCRQMVHETKPDHPIPFPLDLDSSYVSTSLSSWELDIKEKKHAFDGLFLILQAGYNI
jgi:hypothetical protein